MWTTWGCRERGTPSSISSEQQWKGLAASDSRVAALPSTVNLCRGWTDQHSTAHPWAASHPGPLKPVLQREGTADPLRPHTSQPRSFHTPAIWQVLPDHPDPYQQVKRQYLPASHQATELLTLILSHTPTSYTRHTHIVKWLESITHPTLLLKLSVLMD